jgi:hypothetical protein
MLAAVRADNLDFPLFLHVVAATILVGSLVTGLVFAVSGSSSRLTFRSLLWAAIPSWIVMYAGAMWISDKEGLNDLPSDPSWLGIGHMTAEPALLAIVIATVIAGLSAKKAGPTSKWVTGLISLAILLALVAVWAMTTKPT